MALFRSEAESVVEAAQALVAGLKDHSDTEELERKLAALRVTGKAAEQDTLAHLGRSFITPFDRDASYDLARQLAAIVAMIEDTASKLVIYRLPNPPTGSFDQAALVAGASDIVLSSVERVGRDRELSTRQELARLDREGFALLRRLMATLLTSHSDVYSVMIGMDIHRGLQTTLRAVVRTGPLVERLARSHGVGASW